MCMHERIAFDCSKMCPNRIDKMHKAKKEKYQLNFKKIKNLHN